IKATGEGLNRPLTSFSIMPPCGGEKTILGAKWFFHLHSLPGATVALAVEGDGTVPTYTRIDDRLDQFVKTLKPPLKT
ncbi:MAG: hypothetical protein LBT62_04005, partial [Deltaproteobacteria bacterium]|nr:hypothetical protein [Deltaproteobacteria bacterium]